MYSKETRTERVNVPECIISTAQQARPKEIGHIELFRLQLIRSSRRDTTYSVAHAHGVRREGGAVLGSLHVPESPRATAFPARRSPMLPRSRAPDLSVVDAFELNTRPPNVARFA
jgi:hypothetical protein